MLKARLLVRFIKVMTIVGSGEILAADGDVDPTCARRGELPVSSGYPLHDTSQSCLSLLLTFDDITDNRMRIRRSSRQRSCFRHFAFSQTNTIICHKTALAELPPSLINLTATLYIVGRKILGTNWCKNSNIHGVL